MELTETKMADSRIVKKIPNKLAKLFRHDIVEFLPIESRAKW